MRIWRKERLADGRRIVYLLGVKICSYKVRKKNLPQCLVQRARDLGVKIGNNVELISDPCWGSEPWLIEIGDDTCISFNPIFLTHDGSWWACRPYFKKNICMVKLGRIKIGKGCFIGCNTTIMPGVTIGNHCVTAASSVVTKDIPDGEVWGGYLQNLFVKPVS